MVEIEYREFWDVPRLFIFREKGKIYLFNCRFDKSIDDYSDVFKVYRVSEGDILQKDWETMLDNARFLGEVKVANVKFDSTRRQNIDIEILNEFKFDK